MSSSWTQDDASQVVVTALGVRWVHELGYTVDRPHGLDEYVLLRFYSPMLVRTAAGLVNGEPDDCLLYAPRFPQWFSGRGVGHADDHMHVDGPGVSELVSRFRLPVNRLFRPREADFIPPMLTAISRELHRREPFWERSVRTLVETLLLRLGRLTNEHEQSGLKPADLTHAEALRTIRMQVHERLEERWTVARMAGLANLSVSRFGVLYRSLFGTSPIEDLIDAAIGQGAPAACERSSVSWRGGG